MLELLSVIAFFIVVAIIPVCTVVILLVLAIQIVDATAGPTWRDRRLRRLDRHRHRRS